MFGDLKLLFEADVCQFPSWVVVRSFGFHINTADGSLCQRGCSCLNEYLTIATIEDPSGMFRCVVILLVAVFILRTHSIVIEQCDKPIGEVNIQRCANHVKSVPFYSCKSDAMVF